MTFKEDEARIREKAHRIWEEEGRPPGREAAHWEMARELVAIEDNQRLASQPNPVHDGVDRSFEDAPVEPREALDNQGEFPAMADQGEETPHLARHRASKAAREAGGQRRGGTRRRTGP